MEQSGDSKLFHQQFHDSCDESGALKSSSEHCTDNFADSTQRPLKDECKSASKHKVLSEELRDKVDGEPLG
jgi:hypothetical protein